MRLSILVVSRNPERLSAMLQSISGALTLDKGSVEILCSWNGDQDSELKIKNLSGYEFLIAQRKPYHFAQNINDLARKSTGEVLALINDDILMDSGSLDAGLRCLDNQSSPCLIGALLRSPDQRLHHIGFTFDSQNNPYHISEGLIDAAETCDTNLEFEVPAITAAMALVHRETFMKLMFNEHYQRCGEDVEFNLDLREKLQGHVILCPELSGVHAVSATRSEFEESGNTSEDQVRMRSRRHNFLEKATTAQLRVDLNMANKEKVLNQKATDSIKSMRVKYENNYDLKTLKKDRDYWRRQSAVLQLEVLRLKDQLQREQEV